MITTSAPAFFSEAILFASLTAPTTSVFPSLRRRAEGDVSNFESTTILRGCLGVSTPRTLSCGSSSLTVPKPVRTAQARPRQRWPSWRAASPLIHWLRALARAAPPAHPAPDLPRPPAPPPPP